MRRQCLEFIRCGNEGQLGCLRYFGGEFFGKSFFGIEAGAHRGSALSQLIQARQTGLHARDAVLNLRGVA